MLYPTGLDGFHRAFPERTFDVGIAEQHAVTSAAGMALAGLHPVVAIYATFLNRAFDQVLMDVALHRLGVTFVLDRAGVTGEDGPSHNGMWDLSILQVVPGLRLAAPRDATRFRDLLREAVAVTDAPTVLRVPKGPVPADIPAVSSEGGLDVLVPGEANDVLVVSVGALAASCVDAADRLEAQGFGVTVVDPRWVKPVNPALVELARGYRAVVSVEDSGRAAGCGAALTQALSDRGVTTPVKVCGLPQEFLPAAKRTAVHERVGLTGPSLAREITAWLAALDHVEAPSTESTTASDG
jgi:1-deoxy-D-xylulose-5-phosphate synthase